MHSKILKSRPLTVTLLGLTKNTDNYGVRVLLSAAVEAVSTAFPGAAIEMLDYGTRAEKWADVGPKGTVALSLINLRFSWKLHLPNNCFRLLAITAISRLMPVAWREAVWQRNPWLARIADARVHLSIAGGDSFSDIYGFRRFIYVALPQLLVLMMQRPLVQLPQTYGPFRGALANRLARFILSRSHALFSRDEAGAATVNRLLQGKGPVVQVVPDIGLGMSAGQLDERLADWLSSRKRERPLIGINLSGLLLRGGYTGGNMFGLQEPFAKVVDALVELAVTRLQSDVLLVPHVIGVVGSEEDESRVCERLAAAFRDKYGDSVFAPPSTLDHRQMKRVIGHCDFFSGARMHACVAAVSQGVPTLCLAYSDKFSGVMKPLGAGARVADLRILTAAEICEAAAHVFNDRVNLREELRKQAAQLSPFGEQLRQTAAPLLRLDPASHQRELKETELECPVA